MVIVHAGGTRSGAKGRCDLLVLGALLHPQEEDFTLQRTEVESTANFGRWTTSIMYGNYAAQPELGFLDRREGVLGSAKLKLNPNIYLQYYQRR